MHRAIPVLTQRDEVYRLKRVFSVSKNALTHDERRLIACALFIAYRDGIRDEDSGSIVFAGDDYWADYYLAQALCFTHPDPPVNFFLSYLARLTSSRLAIVRCFRLHPLAFLALTTPSGILFNALQLSYFAEIVFCLGLLIEKSLAPKTSADEWWFQRLDGHRFLEAVSDREFLSIFSNAIIWGLVNGVCYFDPTMTLTTKAIWNLSGFFADIIHDWGFARLEKNEYTDLKSSIEKGELHFDGIDLNNDALISNIDNKIKVVNFKEWRLTIAAVLIFAGMVLVFSPALVPALVAFGHLPAPVMYFLVRIIKPIAEMLRSDGAKLVIFAGVCLAGLGGRLLFYNDPTVEKYKALFRDIWALNLAPWFNKETFTKFSWNFAINALVPMGAIGTLMLGTLLCSVPAVIIAACTLMAATFILMKMNVPFWSAATPSPSSKIISYPQFDDSVVDRSSGKLDIPSLKFQVSSEQLTAVHTAAELDQHHFIEILKDWSKNPKRRPPKSTQMINRILHVCAANKSVSPAPSPIIPSPSPSPSPTSERSRLEGPSTDQQITLYPSLVSVSDSSPTRRAVDFRPQLTTVASSPDPKSDADSEIRKRHPELKRPAPITVPLSPDPKPKRSSFNLFSFCCQTDSARAEKPKLCRAASTPAHINVRG